MTPGCTSFPKFVLFITFIQQMPYTGGTTYGHETIATSEDGFLFTRIYSCHCPCRDNIKWPQLCCCDYRGFFLEIFF